MVRVEPGLRKGLISECLGDLKEKPKSMEPVWTQAVSGETRFFLTERARSPNIQSTYGFDGCVPLDRFSMNIHPASSRVCEKAHLPLTEAELFAFWGLPAQKAGAFRG